MFAPQHRSDGNPCARCTLPASKHRAPDTRSAETRRGYYAGRYQPRPKNQDRIIGIDGEGVGRYPHRYTYLAAHDELDASWHVTVANQDTDRLTTVQGLEFILGLPDRALIVGFAFLYDLTKILTDLPDKALYLLFHEGKRAVLVGEKGKERVLYRPIFWKGYALNFMNRKFSVGRWRRGKDDKPEIYQRRTVWDIFRFYQSKFTQALIDWNVADKDKLTRMGDMKDKRSEFDKQRPEDIHAYCQEECTYLAKLCRALINAHKEAGLPLKHYYGAGSTASVFLEKIGAKEARGEIPEGMREPVASAFFGGRFENSVIGPVYGRCFNYDISSAYPYQATFLPCLLCGSWRFVRSPSESVLDRSTLALVHWTIPKITPGPWGTLPVRSKDGTIAFPLGGKGGWVWKDEFLAARRIADVEAVEAWTYHTDCDHAPFKDVPQYYRERIRLGKEGRGIVLKLGTNSIYGKLAQSRGINPPYQSWAWAGNITSGCRAQLLDGLGVHADPRNCLMFATDGIWTRERLNLPLPRDTKTSDLAKPLGGWEEKEFPQGVFCVRPGIYFPLNPTKAQLKEVRARGLGKKVLYEQWPRILDAWENNAEKIEISGLSRFVGAMSAITHAPKADVYTRSENYGEWVDHKIKVSFNPYPKRKRINADGSLEPWGYFDWESVPYDPATKSPESVMLALAEIIAQEQPTGTFGEL